MMTNDGRIPGAAVLLRPYRLDDAEQIAAGCDDPLTQRFLPLLPHPYRVSDAVWWITEGSQAAFADGGGVYAIADPATDRLLGGIGLHRRAVGKAEIGYWLGPWARGRGVTRDAVATLTAYAFRSGFHRVTLRIEPENPASLRVAVAAGFQREGFERAGGDSRDGRRHDMVVWSRLADDPPGRPRACCRICPGAVGARTASSPTACSPTGWSRCDRSARPT